MNFSQDQLNEQDPQFMDIPPIHRGLLEALERRMPERWPNPEMPERDIWIRCGQLQVLQFLRFVYEKQHGEASPDEPESETE